MNKKIVWYPLFVTIMGILYAWAVIKNSPKLVYNIFHSRKKPYWHPKEWLAKEDYDVTENYYHEHS